MSDLYPTPTRLALLRDVANGQVMTDITRNEDVILLFPNAPTEWQTRQGVTSRVRELERVGWVEEDYDDGHWEWQVTAAGRAVLDAHGGAS